MKNFGDMMRQVQDLQTRMQEMQAKLDSIRVTGRAGGGLVTVTLNGKGKMTDASVDATLLKPEEKQIVEDLIVAAHEDAKGKVEQAIAEQLKEVTGGLPLPPGFTLPF